MKKTLINVVLTITVFILYFLQVNFFSWFTIAGIKPNLFVIFILFIGLFGNRSMGIIYGAVCGLMLDLIIEQKVGINMIGLALIGMISIIFDKNFSKDSRMTIMLMVLSTTIIFEVVSYIINYMLYSINIEIFKFIEILIVEVMYNVIITIIIYPVIQRCGYYIENEYKGNRILTQYF
ncbi:MAG: rod shape-determining protein MreD [Clostridia bacterium]|nr:rod shape-determining protein MreD [Clostridia bacterium]